MHIILILTIGLPIVRPHLGQCQKSVYISVPVIFFSKIRLSEHIFQHFTTLLCLPWILVLDSKSITVTLMTTDKKLNNELVVWV